MSVETYINFASLIVALFALAFSIVSFDKQQSRAEVHARAIVKPWLLIKSQKYEDLKSIRLLNYGLGPAIIKKAEFLCGPEGVVTNNISKLFFKNIVWDTYVNVVPNRSIPAGEEMILVKLSLQHLLLQGYTNDQAQSLLEQWSQKKTGIVVRIEYEDIYGNPMPVYNETLV